MPKGSLNVSLKGADDIFSTEESRQEQQREQVQQIPIGELFPFKNHPFKVLDDESMQRTVESVEQYVLSFYNRAKNDNRFLEAFNTLKAKTQDNQIVVERVVPKLGKLSFCKKGKTSILATKRYNEILFNLEH